MNTIQTNIQNLAMLSAVIAFASCEQHKQTTITETGNEIVKVRTPQSDTTATAVEAPSGTVNVQGKVLDINRGKDGYTAKLQTAANEIYFATISHSNLKDHSQYKDAKVGDMLNVSGDLWKMEGDNQITVRELK